MINLRYAGEKNTYEIEFEKVNPHVIQITGDLPVKTKGFVCFRDDVEDDPWDYQGYKTIYRQIEGGVQFSDDGSVYAAPPEPEPEPDQEPYVPTLEEVKEMKTAELNAAQQAAIQQGINVTLADGSVEHFTLTANDQISLMGLQTLIASGAEQIPWHTSDQTEHCKYYNPADMTLIVNAAMQYVSYHVTYFRDLRIYINSLEEKEDVEQAVYGMPLPEEYQSDILKDMHAVMEGSRWR